MQPLVVSFSGLTLAGGVLRVVRRSLGRLAILQRPFESLRILGPALTVPRTLLEPVRQLVLTVFRALPLREPRHSFGQLLTALQALLEPRRLPEWSITSSRFRLPLRIILSPQQQGNLYSISL